MSTSGSNFLQQKNPAQSVLGNNPPVLPLQESLDSRRLFQHIGLPPMAKTALPESTEDIFTPPDDGKLSDVSTAPATISSSPFKQPDSETNPAAPAKEKRYDVPFHQHEIEILAHLSDFTKSPEFKPFQNPRSRRSLTNNDGATVVEELAQDFSTRTLTTRSDGSASSEQVRDRLGRLVYEKFQEGEKWTARFLYYHDQAGKKSPFVQALKSLSADGRFREVQYSKLGQIESEKETLYDLKLAIV